MLLFIIIAAIVGYISRKTRPDPSTFQAFLEEEGKKKKTSSSFTKSPSRWLKSTIGSLLSTDKQKFITVYDCEIVYLIAVATDQSSDNMRVFLGAFGRWWEVPRINFPFLFVRSDQDVQISLPTSESHYENLEKRAIQLKAASNYAMAAETYLEASKASQDPLVEAECLEQAARCLRMSSGDQDGRFISLYDKAAKQYLRMNRPIKAGTIYEMLSKLLPQISIEERIKLIRHGIDAFGQAGDGRSESMKIDLATALATSKRYDEAAILFTEQADRISQDELMKAMAVRWYFLAAICHLQAKNSAIRSRALQITSKRPMMTATPEAKFIQICLNLLDNGLAEDIEVGLQAMEQILDRSASMPLWFHADAYPSIVERIKEAQSDST